MDKHAISSYGSEDGLRGENILSSTDDEGSFVPITFSHSNVSDRSSQISDFQSEAGDADDPSSSSSLPLSTIEGSNHTSTGMTNGSMHHTNRNRGSIDSDTESGGSSHQNVGSGSGIMYYGENTQEGPDDSDSEDDIQRHLRNAGYSSMMTANYRHNHPPPPSSSHSATSSLGFSEADSTRDGTALGNGNAHAHGNGKVFRDARVVMGRPTMDVLKDGSRVLTREDNRSVTTILSAVVIVCIISIAYLDSRLGMNAVANGNSNNAVNSRNRVSSNLKKGGNGGDKGVGDISSLVYFPFSDGTDFSPRGGLDSALSTSEYVPFPSRDRGGSDGDGGGGGGIPASEIVFTDLFHSSLKFQDNFTSIFSELVDDEGQNAGKSSKTKGTTTGTGTGTGTDAKTTKANEKLAVPLLRVPFPSGAFWTNLVIKPSGDRGLSYPIMSYPYAYQWNPSLLQVSYPPLRRLSDDISIRDIFNPDLTFSTEETITKRNIVRFDPLSVTLRYYGIQVNEEGELTGKDPDAATSYWESYLVQGSPYLTMLYNRMTPILTPLSTFQTFTCPRGANGNYKEHATDIDPIAMNETGATNFFGICTREESSNGRDVTLRGVQFLIHTQENLTWMCFASEPITLVFDGTSRRTIRSVGKFSGVLRFVLLPPPLHADNHLLRKGNTYESFPLSSSTGVRRLIYNAHTYPIGAKISWSFKDIPVAQMKHDYKTRQNNGKHRSQAFPRTVTVATVNFEFVTRSMHDNPNLRRTKTSTALLMLALPHHARVLPVGQLVHDLDIKYQSIKGIMTPVLGDKWCYDEELTNIGFDDPESFEQVISTNDNAKKIILDQVKKDLGGVLPTLGENVYGYGKQVARLAQLAHIAAVMEGHLHVDDRTIDKETPSMSLSRRATGLLHKFVTEFLDGKNADNLVYDVNFGGIITKNGLENKEEDFGNGWYNDHHFHYGYILYAAATLGRLNSTFVSEYGTHVDSILYDVAHASNMNSDMSASAYFPFTRHKSWFDGHSFASGLFPFADGKSQESSSEAVNCYYGAYLWSSIRWGSTPGGIERINFAKLLLAMELRGAKTYWHMKDPALTSRMDAIHALRAPPIYDPSFEESLMVGNLGMMDVTVATWFGTEKLYVHMINFMPVTAITKELFRRTYVEEEFERIINPMYDDVEMAWRGYCVADRAMIDPNAAWVDATKLRSYELDSALSQSQVYFWISSMDGFDSSSIAISPDERNPDGSHGISEAASCLSHERCKHLGLGGLCCPTESGDYLQCC